MRNRGLNRIAVAFFFAAASGSLAQITVDNSSSNTSSEPDKTWTITQLNSTPTADNATITNTLSGMGGFSDSDSISITADGLLGWWTADAQAAVTNGSTFITYLSGLTNVSISGYQTDIAVNSSDVTEDLRSNRMGGTLSPNDEVMVFSVDLSNLSSTDKITLTSIGFGIQPGDKFDFVVYDASSNTVAFARWDNSGGLSGNWELEDGDLFLIGVGQSMTDHRDFRVSNFTIDAKVDGVIPPVYLTATGSNGVVALDWLDDPLSSLVDHYAVYRALTPDEGDLVQIDSTPDSFYFDNDVTNDVTYYYRATTVGTNASESGYSDLVSATPTIPTIPRDSFDRWAEHYYLTGDDATMTANADGDPFNNLLEFAFGGDPTNGADGNIIRPTTANVEVNGTNAFAYSFRRLKDRSLNGLEYRLEVTDDLLGIWKRNRSRVKNLHYYGKMSLVWG